MTGWLGLFSHPVFLYIFAGNIDPYSIMSSRLLISILLLSILLPSCNPNKTAAGKAHGSPAKTEGDLLSSRDC